MKLHTAGRMEPQCWLGRTRPPRRAVRRWWDEQHGHLIEMLHQVGHRRRHPFCAGPLARDERRRVRRDGLPGLGGKGWRPVCAVGDHRRRPSSRFGCLIRWGLEGQAQALFDNVASDGPLQVQAFAYRPGVVSNSSQERVVTRQQISVSCNCVKLQLYSLRSDREASPRSTREVSLGAIDVALTAIAVWPVPVMPACGASGWPGWRSMT